jgi:hypothetical protein
MVDQCVFLDVFVNACSTAEKNNIPWREMTKEILESEVYKELDSIQNQSLVYPDCNFIFTFHFLVFSLHLHVSTVLMEGLFDLLYRLFESISCI